MDTNEALTRVLAALERLADEIAKVDARVSELEGADAPGGIPDWARRDYFCGGR